MNAEDREQLDWLAFRYVAGELAPDERRQFERRLEDDLAACDAVSRAVSLTRVICAAEQSRSVLVRPVRRSPLRRSLWIAACVAACVLGLVVGVRLWTSPPTDSADGNEIPPAQLAAVWSVARVRIAGEDSGPFTWPQPVDALGASDPEESTDALLAPGWMFSAVGLEADHESQEEEDG